MQTLATIEETNQNLTYTVKLFEGVGNRRDYRQQPSAHQTVLVG
jgi:hypothetical protein